LLSALSLPPAPSLAAPPGVRLNEILAGPARDWDGNGVFSSRDDEWIELRNPGPSAVDLTGFFVTDGDSLPRFAPTGTLAAGELRVVFGGESYAWERSHGFPAFGLSLANGGDSVMLWWVEGADTVLVDAYTYTSHAAAADRAVGRANDDGPWTLFDALDPYTGTLPPVGSGCAPSPAAANACGTTRARLTTWGRLKALYR
jgi:hypothetical protein